MRIQILNLYKIINGKICSFLDNKNNMIIYTILISVLTLLFWKFNSILGICINVFVIAVILSLTNDIKYVLPEINCVIFNINFGFTSTNIPYSLIILALISLLILIIYLMINHMKLRLTNSLISFLFMGVTTLIPIFWFNLIDKSKIMYYFLYFSDVAYFFVYLFIFISLKKDSLDYEIQSLSWISVLLSMQCGLKILEMLPDSSNVFDSVYYLGWGYCNEAGILILFSLPFIYYLLIKSVNIKHRILEIIKLIISFFGVLFTTSRGTYLFFALEIILLLTVYFFISKNKKKILKISLLSLGLLGFVYILMPLKINKIVQYIIKSVFSLGLNSNGRFDLWKEAIGLFTKNGRNFIFGSGICSILRDTITAAGWQEGQVVFHSTFFETLVIGGLVGFIALVFHFFTKYKAINKLDKILFLSILIGYIVVDLYGMIDNTYHMYYFMIPLAILMACIDKSIFINNSKKEKTEESKNFDVL